MLSVWESRETRDTHTRTRDTHAKGDASAKNEASSLGRVRVVSQLASLTIIGELAHRLWDTLFRVFFSTFDLDQAAKIRQHHRTERCQV